MTLFKKGKKVTKKLQKIDEILNYENKFYVFKNFI